MEKVFFSILLSAVFFMIAGGLTVWLGVWLFSGIKKIIAFLPTVCQDFVFPFLEEGFAWIEELFVLADSSGTELLESSFEGILKSLSSGIISLSNAALSAVAGVATKIPGNFKQAIGIVLLYLVITVVRNIMEPRLVGKQVGLHPVLTLAGMLLGLRLAGFIGMLGVPLLLAFTKKLNDKGIIHLLH